MCLFTPDFVILIGASWYFWFGVVVLLALALVAPHKCVSAQFMHICRLEGRKGGPMRRLTGGEPNFGPREQQEMAQCIFSPVGGGERVRFVGAI